jgi:hypothetical protein
VPPRGYPKRTGFLRLTGAPGLTIELHTQGNTQTINNYIHFRLTQERIRDAHNVATGPLGALGPNPSPRVVRAGRRRVTSAQLRARIS